MEPIATYSEKLIQVRRMFTLYPDRVEVRAKWLLRGEFKNTVPLSNLQPEFRQMRIRYRLFRYASWMLAVGLLVLAFAIYPRLGDKLPPLAWVAVCVAALGAALMALTYQRVTFVRFDAKNGLGGLDIAKAGPEKHRFETFVRQVGKEVRRHEARGA